MAINAFPNLFRNLYAQAGFGPNSLQNVDPSNWTDLQAANFMNYGTEAGTMPSVGTQVTAGVNDLGNSFAQNQSMLNFGLGAAKGIFDAYNTFKTNSLQKDLLNFQKQQYYTNLDTARKTTNMELSDRQARRVSANPNAESVDSYMKKWGV